MEKRPNVSIVIPIYNTAHYLRRCIESVLAQTMSQIEVILVDDGSTDLSGRIADDYAAQDSRITVIHKSNAGLSAARNDGVAAATADYILFLDSDDYVDAQFCERPWRAAVEHDADLVYYMHRRRFENGKVETTTTPFSDGLISEKDALYINNHVAVTAWSMLYDRRLFQNLEFPVGRLCEDMGVTHRFIHAARRIYLINDALYNYSFGRSGSLWSSQGERLIIDAYDMGRLRIGDLEEWGYDVRREKQLLALFYLSHEGRVGPRGEESHRFATQTGRPSEELEPIQRWMLRLYRLSPRAFDCASIATGQRRKR